METPLDQTKTSITTEAKEQRHYLWPIVVFLLSMLFFLVAGLSTNRLTGELIMGAGMISFSAMIFYSLTALIVRKIVKKFRVSPMAGKKNRALEVMSHNTKDSNENLASPYFFKFFNFYLIICLIASIGRLLGETIILLGWIQEDALFKSLPVLALALCFLILLVMRFFGSVALFLNGRIKYLSRIEIAVPVLVVLGELFALAAAYTTLRGAFSFRPLTANPYNYGLADVANTSFFYAKELFIALLASYALYRRGKLSNGIKEDKTFNLLPDSNIAENGSSSLPKILASHEATWIHVSVFVVCTVLSSAMFMYTGWGLLFFGPLAFIILSIYALIFSAIFLRKGSSPVLIYSVMLTAVFSTLSIVLNSGMAADTEYIAYLVPSLFKISSIESVYFKDFFANLLDLTIGYIFFSFIINLIISWTNIYRFKRVSAVIAFIGLLLIGIHISYVAKEAPRLSKITKERIDKIELNQRQAEERAEESLFAFNVREVIDNTVKGRKYSVFTPPEPFSINGNCPYTEKLVSALVEKEPVDAYDFYCLPLVSNKDGNLAKTYNTTVDFSWKTTSQSDPAIYKFWQKGDIYVAVARLDPAAYIWVNANGNTAKESSYNMYPYDERGVEAISGQLERSLVQRAVRQKSRLVMVLYPINADTGVDSIDLRLGLTASFPTINATLLEVSRIKPPKYEDPAWLAEWLKK